MRMTHSLVISRFSISMFMACEKQFPHLFESAALCSSFAINEQLFITFDPCVAAFTCVSSGQRKQLLDKGQHLILLWALLPQFARKGPPHDANTHRCYRVRCSAAGRCEYHTAAEAACMLAASGASTIRRFQLSCRIAHAAAARAAPQQASHLREPAYDDAGSDEPVRRACEPDLRGALKRCGSGIDAAIFARRLSSCCRKSSSTLSAASGSAARQPVQRQSATACWTRCAAAD